MDELLALLGQHWRLLLLYPGGLTAISALGLVRLTLAHNATWHSTRNVTGLDVVLGAGWLLLIALLPLPQTGWPYGLDLPTLLLLIELPHWVWLLQCNDQWMPRAAVLLNTYPLLALAVALVGQGAGSLVVREINQNSELLHWLGVAAWSVALPPLLGLGPWRAAPPARLLESLRILTHLALLVATTLPAHDATPRSAALFAFAAALLPLAVLHRRWQDEPQRWLAWQPWLVGGIAVAALIVSAQQFVQRLG